MVDLLELVEKQISLNNEEKDFVQSVFKPVIKNKKTQILKEGFVADRFFFLKKGLVRVYCISEDGNELTSDIISASNFVTSFESFRKATPSKVIVEAVVDCELLMILKIDYIKLFKEIENWQKFCNSIYEGYLFRSSRRINTLKNLSAKERYLDFLKFNKAIIKDIPVKHLASYLGVKPQSLSRIRKEVAFD